MGSVTVLVTGYGGFLGETLTRQLITAGFRVRGLARRQYPSLTHLGVEAIAGDISDRAALRKALLGCEAVIHTAALAGVWGPWSRYHAVNTQATVALIEEAVRSGCRAMVYTSSPSVTFDSANQSGIDESVPYPNRWLCHYPHTKALAEQAVLDAGRRGELATCALRPHLIWGNGDPHLMPRVISRAQCGKLWRVGTGKNLIDIVHVDNAANAHLLALRCLLAGDSKVNAQAFFITDGVPQECWQWIGRILNAANLQVPTKSLSFETAYRIGGALEVAFKALRIRSEPPMTRFVAAQLALDHYFSIEKARALLKYLPKCDSDAALEECVPWLRTLVKRKRV